MNVYVPWACPVSTTAKGRLWISWDWSYSTRTGVRHQVGAEDWIPSSGKIASALYDWAISPAPRYAFLYALCISTVESKCTITNSLSPHFSGKQHLPNAGIKEWHCTLLDCYVPWYLIVKLKNEENIPGRKKCHKCLHWPVNTYQQRAHKPVTYRVRSCSVPPH